jgi:probable HAF family extracellular repeat protein
LFTASVATGLAGGTAAQASTQTYSITDLGTLGGSYTYAYGINGNGQIAGKSLVKLKNNNTYSYTYHTFLYSAGTMTDLGALGDASVAKAINTSGVMVGTAYVVYSNGTAAWHAFIYTGGQLLDLNNLIPSNSGWLLTDATGINDKGQIVCNAYSPSGNTHAVLLNPN